MIPAQATIPAVTVDPGIPEVTIDPGTLLGAVAVLVGAYLLTRLASVALSALAERDPRRRITIKMFIPFVKLIIYATAVYLVLGPLLQLSATQLLAVSGLIGAALGFGLQDLISSVVGGLVLIFEKPYQVGDKIDVGGDYGEVTDIGLRSTTLTTPDDNAVTVPNDTFFTKNVANANDGTAQMMVVIEVAVAPDADLDAATAVVEEAIVTSKYVYVDEDHPAVVRIRDDSYYRMIRGKAYVADLRDEFAFSTDVTKRALAAFEEQGIETPELPPDRFGRE